MAALSSLNSAAAAGAPVRSRGNDRAATPADGRDFASLVDRAATPEAGATKSGTAKAEATESAASPARSDAAAAPQSTRDDAAASAPQRPDGRRAAVKPALQAPITEPVIDPPTPDETDAVADGAQKDDAGKDGDPAAVADSANPPVVLPSPPPIVSPLAQPISAEAASESTGVAALDLFGTMKGRDGKVSSPDAMGAAETQVAPEAPGAAMVEAAGNKAIAEKSADLAKATAASLLQLARDHIDREKTSVKTADTNDAASDSADMVSHIAFSGDKAPVGSAPQPVQVAAPAGSLAAAAPTIDLSATLGAQVVDMGVSGQWIDGLARDIAGLSAHGAQGRFQINAAQLGPVQVDIRQGADGTAVNLTVATEAAETALRQDSDRLRLDASLSAMRITDVRIERAPVVTEATRADAAHQQSGQQSGSGNAASHGQGNGQAAGQGMAQSQSQGQSQGRWQSRENLGGTPKSLGDPVVLNHVGAGDSIGDGVRARYA